MSKKKQYILLGIIIFLGFLVRLYKIDNPVADWHSWRQADTSAVTRNFIKFGLDLFRPRYDDFSDVSGKGLYNPLGYRFVEFPVFNLFHYIFVKVAPFGTLEFWGRMTSIISALFSSLFLFLIIRRRTNPGTALLGAFLYLFLPYNIYFTRVILPDPLMVTFYLGGIYFYHRWSDRSGNRDLFFGILFSSLAVLVKPVAVFFLLPVLWILVKKYGVGFFRKPQVLISGIGILLPFALWRIWESRFPQGIPASSWLLNGNHIRFKGAFFRWIFGERISNLILGGWGIYPLLSGISVSGLAPWIFGALLYLFTFATGNVQHDYYQIPIIPIISILLSTGAVRLWKENLIQKMLVIICLGFALAFSWYQVKGLYQVNHWAIVEAGRAVDRLVPQDAVVVAPYLGDTAFLYQTNRPGFPFMTMPIKDMIDNYRASYYVSVNYDDETNAIMRKYTVVEKTADFVIVKLVEPILP